MTVAGSSAVRFLPPPPPPGNPFAGDRSAELATSRVGGARVEHYRQRLLTSDQLLALPAPEWLIEDILPNPGLAMLYGPPNCHKTFLALDWALSVAAGRAWEAGGGHKTLAGPTVYVAAEGAHGISVRVSAWEEWNRAKSENVLWLPDPVQLLDRADIESFGQAIASHEPRLVVFDTLARCAVGGDENSAQDMGRAVDNLGWLARELHATVLIVHHTGKDGLEYRGSSALLGAVDAAVKLSGNGQITLECTKQKDGPRFANIGLEPREMGDSLVLSGAWHETTGKGDALLELLCQVSAIQAVAGSQFQALAEAELKMPRRSYYRAVNALVNRGFAQNIGTDKRAMLKATKVGHETVRATVSATSAK